MLLLLFSRELHEDFDEFVLDVALGKSAMESGGSIFNDLDDAMKWCLALRKRFDGLKEMAESFSKSEAKEKEKAEGEGEDDDQPQPKRVRYSRKQSMITGAAASSSEATTAAAIAARPT